MLNREASIPRPAQETRVQAATADPELEVEDGR